MIRWWVTSASTDRRPSGSVEIGYAVVPARRGCGLATRACALIVEVAWRAGAEEVLAEAEPDNPASRKVLLNNGFTAVDDRRFVINRPASR